MIPLTREQMAWRAAQDLSEGAYVNLGIGIPTLAASYVPPGREVIFHSENASWHGSKPEPAGKTYGRCRQESDDAGPRRLLRPSRRCAPDDPRRPSRSACSAPSKYRKDLVNWTTEDPAFRPASAASLMAVGARNPYHYGAH
jgi:3-oxoadipate CoA-transferase beta subunit